MLRYTNIKDRNQGLMKSELHSKEQIKVVQTCDVHEENAAHKNGGNMSSGRPRTRWMGLNQKGYRNERQKM